MHTDDIAYIRATIARDKPISAKYTRILLEENTQLRTELERAEKERDSYRHKAEQYDDVVRAVRAADGGRYRADVISAILARAGAQEG